MPTPKPLINIIWTCQEMMVWMSMELMESVDIIWYGYCGVIAQLLGKTIG
jgi:hypothetical protein